MRHSLLAGALLLTYCDLCSAADYDSPPSNIIVERPGWPYDLGEYGVAMDERSPVFMTCSADGKPAPTYRWEKSGIAVNTSDPRITVVGGRLEIDTPTADDEGSYQCFANNTYGTALSSKYQTMYAFQEHFADTEIKRWTFDEGDEALVICDAPDGAPKPKVYWTDVDSVEVTTDNRVTYTERGDLFFSNILDEDKGPYYCFAANELLGSFQRSVGHVLKVNTGSGEQRAATIAQLPDAVTGLRTEKFVIKCLASGFPTPSITWYRNGAELSGNSDVSLKEFNQELTFRSLSFEDAGAYECRASNAANEESAKKMVHLTVVSSPYFSVAPADLVIPPGATDQIHCDAGGVPPPTFEWLQNGGPIQIAEGSPYQVDGSIINIIEPREGQSTVFQCILDNIHGEEVGSYTITVLAIPATISESPVPRVVEAEGGVVSLRCVTFGSPAPTVEWQKDGVKLNDSGRIIISTENQGQTSTLDVTELVLNDGGDYTCHALNSVGNSSASSNVLVRLPTAATMTPPNQTVQRGNRAVFTCQVIHDLLAEPSITWFFNDNEIYLNKEGSEYSLRNVEQLRVLSAKSSHTGTFKCVVTTRYDEAFSTAELTVQGEPDPPYNVVVEVVGLQATLQWVQPADNNAEITTYTIEWKTQHDTFPTPNDPRLAPWDVLREISASSSTETIELENYLEYSFRVIATNEVGNSQRSDVVTGPMTAAAPPDGNSVPGNVQSEATKPGVLTVSWDEVHPYHHNGPDFAYVVRWRPEGETEWREEVINDWETTSFDIKGDEYQNIEYSVGVRNTEADGPEPVRKEATTGQGRPSAAPSNVQLVALGSNEINVTWDAVPAEDVNGELSHYKVYYTMETAQGSEEVQECPAAETSCVVGGLEAYTTYSVEVSVVNALQEGPRSKAITIQTNEGVPTIAKIATFKSTSYRLAVTWAPPAQANGVHRGYHLFITGSRGDDIVSENNETIDDTDQTMFKMEEAEPDTTYEVTLTAYTNVGDSDPSKQSTETGAAGAPPIPGMPELDEASEKHLNLTWPLVGKDDPKPDEVRACYKIKDAEEDCVPTPWVDVLEEDKIHVHPLDGGTEYVVFLEYKNQEGSVAGPPDSFATIGQEPVKGGGAALQPWFIAIICVIILLLLILLIICILKSQKGGKYNVSDKENQLKDESAPLKNNDGFAEFNNDSEFPDDMEGSQDSLASNPDDGDSLKEYADDEDPSKFNEDGSFVEEYHDPQSRSTDTREGGTSTFV